MTKAERCERIAQEMSGHDPCKVRDLAEKIAADTARYEALAREHGADLSEEGFKEVLKKLGTKPASEKPVFKQDD